MPPFIVSAELGTFVCSYIMVLQMLHLALFSQTFLLRGLQQVTNHLQSPVLIYHDGENNEIDIILQSLSYTQSLAVMVARLPEQPSSDKSQLPRSAVLVANNPETLVSYLKPWSMWNGRTRVLVIAKNETHVHSWLSTLWLQTRAVNVVVMVTEPNTSYYTWFPYQTRSDCGNVLLNAEKISQDQLFLEKVNPPLNNCPLVAVTSNLPPLVVSKTQGIEPRLFYDIAEKLGMKATFENLPLGKYVWTTLDLNRKPANGLKMLWENKVDVSFSQLGRHYGPSHYAEFLPSHVQDTSVFFAPGPKPAPRTAALYKAFSPQAWIWVFSTSLALYLTTVLIPYFETKKFSPAFLETVALVFYLPANFPKTKVFAYFAVIAYLYSMHITTAYQSSLIVFLSDVPREIPIKTLEDLDKSPFPVEFHDVERSIFKHSSDPHIKSMFSRPGKVFFSAYLSIFVIAQHGNVSLLGPKLAFETIIMQDMFFDEFGYPKVVVLKDDIFTSSLCFYVSKGHPLYPLMSHYMMHLIEAGMPQHYLREVRKLPRPVLPQLRPFSIENVEGPFVVYGVMLVLCMLTWLLECFYGFLTKGKRAKLKQKKQTKRTFGFVPHQFVLSFQRKSNFMNKN